MLWSLYLGAPLLCKKPRKEIIHNMALIDEYKQAIQDVLDGRAPEAPRPSELPWTEDKAATMWAAAAAELIAAGKIPEVGPLIVNCVSDTLDKTWQEIHDAILTRGAVAYYSNENAAIGLILAYPDGGSYYIETLSGAFVAETTDGYPTAAS